MHESWRRAKPPPTLNRQSQEGQGMWGCGREDRTTNIGEIHNGCGEQDKKGADKLKKGKRINQSKFKRMGMMG